MDFLGCDGGRLGASEGGIVEDAEKATPLPYSSYARLMTMLGKGWEIKPPVYVRPRWRQTSQREDAYHFVIWHGDKVDVVSVFDCPEIREFLAASKLAIDRL